MQCVCFIRSTQCMTWTSSCKAYDRSIRSSLSSLTLSLGWTIKFRSVRWGRLAVAILLWDFKLQMPRSVLSHGRSSIWRTVLLGVRTMSDVIWGKYSPKTHQKGAWIGSFKPKLHNTYMTISPELLIRLSSDLRTEFRPRKALRGLSSITPR